MNSKYAVIASLLFASWMSTTLAAEPSARSGTIYFRGALVTGSCEINSAQNQVYASCYRNGQNQLSRLSLKQRQTNVAEFGSTDVRWLDSAHKQGIMTVNYR